MFKEFGPDLNNCNPYSITPNGIAATPDGNLWFTEPFNNKIGRMAPGGVVTEFALAVPPQPLDITTGPDGNLWFTEYSANQLARITPNGVVTVMHKVRGGPWGIGGGLNNTIWLTQFV